MAAGKADMAAQMSMGGGQVRCGVADVMMGGCVSSGGSEERCAGQCRAKQNQAGFCPKSAELAFAGHQILRPRLPLRQYVMLSGYGWIAFNAIRNCDKNAT